MSDKNKKTTKSLPEFQQELEALLSDVKRRETRPILAQKSAWAMKRHWRDAVIGASVLGGVGAAYAQNQIGVTSIPIMIICALVAYKMMQGKTNQKITERFHPKARDFHTHYDGDLDEKNQRIHELMDVIYGADLQKIIDEYGLGLQRDGLTQDDIESKFDELDQAIEKAYANLNITSNKLNGNRAMVGVYLVGLLATICVSVQMGDKAPKVWIPVILSAVGGVAGMLYVLEQGVGSFNHHDNFSKLKSRKEKLRDEIEGLKTQEKGLIILNELFQEQAQGKPLSAGNDNQAGILDLDECPTKNVEYAYLDKNTKSLDL